MARHVWRLYAWQGPRWQWRVPGHWEQAPGRWYVWGSYLNRSSARFWARILRRLGRPRRVRKEDV